MAKKEGRRPQKKSENSRGEACWTFAGKKFKVLFFAFCFIRVFNIKNKKARRKCGNHKEEKAVVATPNSKDMSRCQLPTVHITPHNLRPMYRNTTSSFYVEW